VFNITGSEFFFLLIVALVILGPEKLPDALRKVGKAYAEFKKMAGGFQQELHSALDEPMRELIGTADAFKSAASFDLAADILEGKPVSAAPPAPADDVFAGKIMSSAPPEQAAEFVATAGAEPPFVPVVPSEQPAFDSVVISAPEPPPPPAPAPAFDAVVISSEPPASAHPEPVAAEPVRPEPAAAEPTQPEPAAGEASSS